MLASVISPVVNFASKIVWLLCGFMQTLGCRLHGPLSQQMIELSDEHNSASFISLQTAPFACKENAKFLQRGGGINFSSRGANSEEDLDFHRERQFVPDW